MHQLDFIVDVWPHPAGAGVSESYLRLYGAGDDFGGLLRIYPPVGDHVFDGSDDEACLLCPGSAPNYSETSNRLRIRIPSFQASGWQIQSDPDRWWGQLLIFNTGAAEFQISNNGQNSGFGTLTEGLADDESLSLLIRRGGDILILDFDDADDDEDPYEWAQTAEGILWYNAARGNGETVQVAIVDFSKPSLSNDKTRIVTQSFLQLY